MAFQVTATKARPQTFDSLLGQEFVVSTLTSAIENERIAQAYLFSGPRGVGKTSAARILARSLNCEKGPSSKPCGVCDSCTSITNGNPIDVIEIDGASNTGVNDIREIKEEVLFAPGNSRYKIYIIDEVHMLSNSAFNALLKTIEEPPPYIIFIFATTEIHKVPATIRSRCQQFNFRLFSLDVIKTLLTRAAEDLNIKFEDEALLWVAKEATGSMRDAYTLFDQVVSFSEGHLTLDKIREKLGLVGVEQVGEVVTLMVEEKLSELLLKCDEMLGTGISIEQYLIELAEYFRNLLMIKNGIKRESILGCGAESFPESLVSSLSINQLLYCQELILSLFKEIKFSLNPRFELDLLLGKLCQIGKYIPQQEILSRLEELQQQMLSGVNGSVTVKKKA